MTTFLHYILVSAATLSVMYLAYRLSASRVKQFGTNRLTLILICALSFMAPLIADRLHSFTPGDTIFITPLPTIGQLPASSSAITLAISIYAVGVVLLLGHSLFQYLRLLSVIRHGTLVSDECGKVIISDFDRVAPFSFGKYIVMSRADWDTDREMILCHERQHISHRHWIDLLFVRLTVVFQWFNPLAWMLERDLKNVHEFQADACVIGSGINKRQYQTLLLDKVLAPKFGNVANNFNSGSLKSRIAMMQAPKPSLIQRCSPLFLLPIAAVTLYLLPAFHPGNSEDLAYLLKLNGVQHEGVVNIIDPDNIKSLTIEKVSDKVRVIHIKTKE